MAAEVPGIEVVGGEVAFGTLARFWFKAVWPRVSQQLLAAHHLTSHAKQSVTVTVEYEEQSQRGARGASGAPRS